MAAIRVLLLRWNAHPSNLSIDSKYVNYQYCSKKKKKLAESNFQGAGAKKKHPIFVCSSSVLSQRQRSPLFFANGIRGIQQDMFGVPPLPGPRDCKALEKTNNGRGCDMKGIEKQKKKKKNENRYYILLYTGEIDPETYNSGTPSAAPKPAAGRAWVGGGGVPSFNLPLTLPLTVGCWEIQRAGQQRERRTLSLSFIISSGESRPRNSREETVCVWVNLRGWRLAGLMQARTHSRQRHMLR